MPCPCGSPMPWSPCATPDSSIRTGGSSSPAERRVAQVATLRGRCLQGAPALQGRRRRPGTGMRAKFVWAYAVVALAAGALHWRLGSPGARAIAWDLLGAIAVALAWLGIATNRPNPV